MKYLYFNICLWSYSNQKYSNYHWYESTLAIYYKHFYTYFLVVYSFTRRNFRIILTYSTFCCCISKDCKRRFEDLNVINLTPFDCLLPFFLSRFHCNAVIFTSILKIEETTTLCPTKNTHLCHWTIGQHDKHDETILHLWVMDCTSVGSCLCTILLNDMVRHFFNEEIV